MLLKFSVTQLFLLSSFALASSQGTFEQLAQSASQAREANRVDDAITLYESALAMQPAWPQGLFFLGSLLYDSDRFAAAESALDRFVKSTPDATPAFGLLGLCEFETGHYAASLKHIQQAPAQEGQMGAVLRFHEAQLLAKTGDYDKSLQVYSTFLQNGEAPKSVVEPLGIAALRQPLMAREIPPTQHDLYIAAGQTAAAILSGDDQRSRAALADLLERFPNSAGVHFVNGFYYVAQKPDLAVEEFKRELTINASNVSANSMLAWLLLSRRETSIAVPYAKRAFSAASDDPMALYVYGRALSESGQVPQGIAILEKALKADPQNLETHLALTSAYSKAGRTMEARAERQRSLLLAREVTPVYIH